MMRDEGGVPLALLEETPHSAGGDVTGCLGGWAGECAADGLLLECV